MQRKVGRKIGIGGISLQPGEPKRNDAMTTAKSNALDVLWRSIPKRLEEEEDGWALDQVLKAGVAGYTRDDDTPPGLLIRHNPDGSRQLVRINLDGPDTVMRYL
jgi:hypothetical protein